MCKWSKSSQFPHLYLVESVTEISTQKSSCSFPSHETFRVQCAFHFICNGKGRRLAFSGNFCFVPKGKTFERLQRFDANQAFCLRVACNPNFTSVNSFLRMVWFDMIGLLRNRPENRCAMKGKMQTLL